MHINYPRYFMLITESKDPTYRGPIVQRATDDHVYSSDVGSSASGLKITVFAMAL